MQDEELVYLRNIWSSFFCFTFVGNLLEVVAGQRGIKIRRRESEAQFGCGVRYTTLPADQQKQRSISFTIGAQIGTS